MRKIALSLLLIIFTQVAFAEASFEITPLGVNGGITDGNLSGYLLKPINSSNYVMLDAGTLINGLGNSANIKNLIEKQIPAYLISHAHLDHVMSFVIAQPELREHQILMARKETLEALEKNIFNWSVWGNFGDAGDKPQLGYQHYQTLPLQQWTPVPQTDMQVQAFPLSHGNGFKSTAFLVRYQNEYILYFGDTGADEIEKSTNIKNIWVTIAPLVRNRQLHAIMLECSYTNATPDAQLFGHLKPTLFMSELHQLAALVNPADPAKSLRGLTVIVTHIKPTLDSLSGLSAPVSKTVEDELTEENDLGVRVILAKQGGVLMV